VEKFSLFPGIILTATLTEDAFMETNEQILVGIFSLFD